VFLGSRYRVPSPAWPCFVGGWAARRASPNLRSLDWPAGWVAFCAVRFASGVRCTAVPGLAPTRPIGQGFGPGLGSWVGLGRISASWSRQRGIALACRPCLSACLVLPELSAAQVAESMVWAPAVLVVGATRSVGRVAGTPGRRCLLARVQEGPRPWQLKFPACVMRQALVPDPAQQRERAQGSSGYARDQGASGITRFHSGIVHDLSLLHGRSAVRSVG
jgi:hypothetical protein